MPDGTTVDAYLAERPDMGVDGSCVLPNDVVARWQLALSRDMTL